MLQCRRLGRSAYRSSRFSDHNQRQPMKLNRTPIASAVALVIAGVGACVTFPAQAQQAPAPADLGTVSVTGIRASIEQSLNVKRDADTRVEVINAEDIGKMPDKNVAD